MPSEFTNRLRMPVDATILPVLKNESSIATDCKTYTCPFIFKVDTETPSLDTTHVVIDPLHWKLSTSKSISHSGIRQWIVDNHTEILALNTGERDRTSSRKVLSDLRDRLTSKIGEWDGGTTTYAVTAVTDEFTSPVLDSGVRNAVKLFLGEATRQANGEEPSDEWLKSLAGWREISMDGSFKDVYATHRRYLEVASDDIRAIKKARDSELRKRAASSATASAEPSDALEIASGL